MSRNAHECSCETCCYIRNAEHWDFRKCCHSLPDAKRAEDEFGWLERAYGYLQVLNYSLRIPVPRTEIYKTKVRCHAREVTTYSYAFILLLIRLMPVSLCLQPQHSHTLQYTPLCLHFAVDKAYACVPMPSATAFPYTAVRTPVSHFRTSMVFTIAYPH